RHALLEAALQHRHQLLPLAHAIEVAWITIRKLRQPKHFAERDPEVLPAEAGDHDKAIGRLERLVRNCRLVRTADRLGDDAIGQVVLGHVCQERHLHVQQADVDLLALAGPEALDERRTDRKRGKKSATQVADRDSAPNRLAAARGRSIVTLFLLRVTARKYALSPLMKGGPILRIGSPSSGSSTLITSAPMSASSIVA